MCLAERCGTVGIVGRTQPGRSAGTPSHETDAGRAGNPVTVGDA
jgi:hypothetical protein